MVVLTDSLLILNFTGCQYTYVPHLGKLLTSDLYTRCHHCTPTLLPAYAALAQMTIHINNIVNQLNSFGAIGDYSRPLVDRYCRLWST